MSQKVMRSSPDGNPVGNPVVIYPNASEHVPQPSGLKPSLGHPPKEDEFASFNKLARKLIEVPKAELDEQRERC